MNRHLHIHCGLHKTASTSFQKYLHLNREALRNAGVLYPQYAESFQHSMLLWETQKKGLDVAKKYLKSLLDTDKACGACLISGEDFENYIYNTGAASMFEEMSLDLGFKSVTWHVVVRPMKDYVNSLYNELSKHEVLIKRTTLELAARERGCFFVSTNNYNYIFTLDYQRFRSQFRKCVRAVKEYDFSEFCDAEIGWPLLRSIIPLESQERFQKEATALTKKTIIPSVRFE